MFIKSLFIVILASQLAVLTNKNIIKKVGTCITIVLGQILSAILLVYIFEKDNEYAQMIGVETFMIIGFYYFDMWLYKKKEQKNP